MDDMKATRIYTRAYMSRNKSKEPEVRIEDLSKIEIRFDSRLLDTLITFSQLEWERIEVDRFPSQQSSIIRTVMVQYLTTLLSRPLNLHAYLEELGR